MGSYGSAEAQVAHAIMFHHFHGPDHLPGQGSIDASELEQLLDFVSDGFDLIGAEEWEDRVQRGQLEPTQICLTFDDALLSQFDVAAPVLKKRNISAFFFVYSSVFKGGIEPLEVYRAFRMNHFDDIEEFYQNFHEVIDDSPHRTKVGAAMENFVPADYLAQHTFYSEGDRIFRFVRDKVLGPDSYYDVMDRMIDRITSKEELAKGLWMTEENLQTLMSDGHVLGGHSYTHPTDMAGGSIEYQDREYRLNAEHLNEVIGKAPYSMAHPCDSFTGATLDVLKKYGFQMGFRSWMAPAETSGFEIPREDHANVMRMIAESS
jgi:peptidoglycan/xylan/chitin deacetylase (PgdA/CDA1 family)